jgi:hypothetical protein
MVHEEVDKRFYHNTSRIVLASVLTLFHDNTVLALYFHTVAHNYCPARLHAVAVNLNIKNHSRS